MENKIVKEKAEQILPLLSGLSYKEIKRIAFKLIELAEDNCKNEQKIS